MDQDTQTQLPQGSPILAYGLARHQPIGRKTLALIAGLFVVFCAAIVITVRATVQFPDRILALAVVKGNIELPAGYPLPWTSVGKTTFPKLIGVAMTDAGPEAFAVVVGPVPVSGLNVDRSGAFAFVSERPLRRVVPRRLGSLLMFTAESLFHPAYLRVDPSALSAELTQTIEGRIDASGTWITDARLPARSPQHMPLTDVAIDLTAFPDAWPQIRQALNATGFPLDDILPPSSFGWNVSRTTLPHIELGYEDGVPTSTALAFAAASGIFDQRLYVLPGNIVAEELRTPVSVLSATATTDWDISSGTKMTLSANSIDLRSDQPQMEGIDTAPCSSGRLVFSLRPNAFRDILFKLGLSGSLHVPEVDAFERAGRLVVCTK